MFLNIDPSDASTSKFDIPPVSHVGAVDIFRQRMLIKPPVDPRNAVREYVVLIRLIPLDKVTVLLGKLTQIAQNKMSWHSRE